MKRMLDKEKIIRFIEEEISVCESVDQGYRTIDLPALRDILALLKEQIPDSSKYQYKFDHTDCIWYRDSRSKCPVTCSQYRDGWNDAMYYIFKGGKGYSPYERR